MVPLIAVKISELEEDKFGFDYKVLWDIQIEFSRELSDVIKIHRFRCVAAAVMNKYC